MVTFISLRFRAEILIWENFDETIFFSSAELWYDNGIKVRVFFGKDIEKKYLCHHHKNYCCFCKSNIPVINLIVGSRNMSKLSKNTSFLKLSQKTR